MNLLGSEQICKLFSKSCYRCSSLGREDSAVRPLSFLESLEQDWTLGRVSGHSRRIVLIFCPLEMKFLVYKN